MMVDDPPQACRGAEMAAGLLVGEPVSGGREGEMEGVSPGSKVNKAQEQTLEHLL